MSRLLRATRTTAASAMALALGVAACGDAPSRTASSPHILFLSVDTLRPDYLGIHGYDRDTSPYLDSLLADAFHFPKAVSTVPRTTQALASLLTGAYPHRTGVRRLLDNLRDDVTPITEVLKADGYGTHAIVSNQVLVPERMLSRGFDTYLNAEDSREAEATTDVALRVVADNDFSHHNSSGCTTSIPTSPT